MRNELGKICHCGISLQRSTQAGKEPIPESQIREQWLARNLVNTYKNSYLYLCGWNKTIKSRVICSCQLDLHLVVDIIGQWFCLFTFRPTLVEFYDKPQWRQRQFVQFILQMSSFTDVDAPDSQIPRHFFFCPCYLQWSQDGSHISGWDRWLGLWSFFSYSIENPVSICICPRYWDIIINA